jgi:putative flavoprotein involved in K+ transport
VLPRDGAWAVRTQNGAEFTARTVVAASGAFRSRHTPTVPGNEEFAGQSLHAADYRSPEPFTGQRVVVVGGGNSAVQIAAELGASP